MFDVVIVGGGPAGLNAALFLGRSRRKVLLCDAGKPRNRRSRWVSGFLTRDGTRPHDLRRLARDELAAYPSVEIRDLHVAAASRAPDGFTVELETGERVASRKLLLATGLMDDAPDFPDARRFYGRGVYPCPYCDGWEHKDEPLVAFGRGASGRGIALELTAWSRDVTLVTHGAAGLCEAQRRDLDRHGIGVVEEPILALDGDPDAGGLKRIRFEDGRAIETGALFFAFEACRQSGLVEQLGIEVGDTGAVTTGQCERTNVPGLYVAGDASRRVQFAVVAAAEGAMAAFALNTELLQEDLKHRARETEPA